MPSSFTSSFTRNSGGLKRTVGLRPTAFRRKADAAPLQRHKPLQRGSTFVKEVPRPSAPPAPARPSTRRGTYAGGTTGPVPRPRARRRPRLLALARAMPCLLQVPGICNRDPETTVACHSNWSEHGKAGARRADDCHSAWGCRACHAWLDQGDADAAEKRPIFDAALLRQVEWWERIAADPARSEPDRRAARWALEQLRVDAAPPEPRPELPTAREPLVGRTAEACRT